MIETVNPNFAPSKQLRYYYRNRKSRLDYQRNYYNKHKTTILTKKLVNYQLNKVKRTNKYIRLIHDIKTNIEFTFGRVRQRIYDRYYDIEVYNQKNNEVNQLYDRVFNHVHGRPKEYVYNVYPRGRLELHLIPELHFEHVESKVAPRFDKLEVVLEPTETSISARQLSIQTAHFLGLKAGDSITWKEISDYGRVETHTLCFDGSGLDISHLNDLPKLVALRIEFDVKGPELISMLAYKYALNGEISLWRGNKLQVTSDLDKAYKLHSEAWQK